MAPRCLLSLVALASLAASCNSHPLTPITVETVVETREEFRQVEANVQKVDFLFVVDNSGSMEEEQVNLAANFGAFIDLITATRADFRIAVISTDMVSSAESGRFLAKPLNPKILTNETPNLKTVFSENARLGTMGDGFEKGLQAIEAALSPPLIDNENAGFLRDDAILAIVLVSDEEDCSHEPGVIPEFDGDECVRNIQRMIPVQHYVDFLVGVKNGARDRIFFAAITGPDIARSTNRPQCVRDNECATGKCSDGKCCPPNPSFASCATNDDCAGSPGTSCVGRKCLPTIPTETRRPYPPRDCSCFAVGTGLAEPGTRYIDMVRAFGTNGVYASICAADWNRSLVEIAGGVVELICKFGFKDSGPGGTLGFKANPNILPREMRDIVVKINGQEVPEGWNYNCPEAGSAEFDKGSVSFTAAACPPVGATVQFFFEPALSPPVECGTRNPAGRCAAGQRCGNCGYCEPLPGAVDGGSG